MSDSFIKINCALQKTKSNWITCILCFSYLAFLFDCLGSLDKNGEKKLWLKPGDYKIISTKSENYVWSNSISLDAKEIHEEKLIISKKSKLMLLSLQKT